MALIISIPQQSTLFSFLASAARVPSNFSKMGEFKPAILNKVTKMIGMKVEEIRMVYEGAAVMYEDMEELRARIAMGEVKGVRGREDVCSFRECEGAGWGELLRNPNADIRHLAYLENSTLAWWNELSDIAEAMENWQRTDENAHLFTKYGPRVSQLLPSAQPGTLKRKRGNTNKHTANLPVVAVKSTYNEMLAYHVQRITNSGPLEDNRDRADGKHSTRAFNTSSTRYPDWPLARELDNVISDDMANDGKWQCPVVGCKYDENGRPCKTKDSLYRHFRTQHLDDKKDGKMMDLGRGTLVPVSEEVDREFRGEKWWGGGALYDAGFVEGVVEEQGGEGDGV